MSRPLIKRLRIFADIARPKTLTDLLGNQRLSYFRGNDIQFEIAVAENGNLIDASKIEEIIIQVKDLANGQAPPPSSPSLIEVTLGSANINDNLTLADWKSGEYEHGTLVVSAEDSNIAAGEKHFVLWITTNETPANTTTYIVGRLNVEEDGAGLIAPPDPIENYLSTTTGDARYYQRGLVDQLLSDKADLVGGKVPAAQLPVGETLSVADNAAKLALTDIQAGQRVRITGEGDRVEMYLGESESTEVSHLQVTSSDSFVAGTWYPSEYTFEDKFFYSKTPDVDPMTITSSDSRVSILYKGSSYWVFGNNDELSPSTYWELYLANEATTDPWEVTSWYDQDSRGGEPIAIAPTYEMSGPESDANWVTLIAGGKRYPVFQIDVPYASGFTDFELKASITNFTGASAEDKFAYIYHSPDPDLAQAIYDTKPLVYYTRSGANTIVHYQQATTTSIYSDLPDGDSEVGSIFVIVLGDEAWKYDGNPDLSWAYVLWDSIGPVEDGATPPRQIWRAATPVKWITASEFPAFLDQ